MNSLMSDAFSSNFERMPDVLRAALALQALPVYYILLFAIGAYLFFHSRRMRMEHLPQVDLLLDEFPSLAKLEKGLPSGAADAKAPDSAASGDGASNGDGKPASVGKRRRLSIPWRRKKPAAEHVEEALKDDQKGAAASIDADSAEPREDATSVGGARAREGIVRLPVHDAPLMLLAAAITCAVLVFVSLVAPVIGGDPVTQMLRGGETKGGDALVRHLMTGKDSFFVPMVIYTVLGAILMALLASRLFRFLNLEWLHIEPFSRRAAIVRRTWRALCFVDMHRLDGSIEHWLTKALPTYITLLFLADIMALFNGFPLPPALAAAAHLAPAALPRMFAPVWASRIPFSRRSGSRGLKLDAEDLAEHMSQERYLGGLSGGTKVEKLDSVVLGVENPIQDDGEDLAPRLVEGLDIVDRRDLAPFLAHAVSGLLDRRESIVASGPRGSGRAIVAGLAAVEAAFRGGTTLIVAQDDQQAARMIEWFAGFGRKYPAFRALKATRAQDNHFHEFKGAQNEVDILVCSLQRFDRIADHDGHLGNFWDRLDLMVLMDVDTTPPLARVELPYIVRRATALARQANFTLPVFVTVLDGAREDQQTFADLLGRQFLQLPFGHAVPARIDIMLVAAPGRGSVTFDSDQDLFTRFGAGLADAGYQRYFLNVHPQVRSSLERLDQARPTDRAEDFRDEPIVVSLARLQPETLFSQLSEIRELSRSCRTGHHICFLMTPTDGFDAWLQDKDQLRQLLEMRADLLAPVFMAASGNKALMYRHLVRAVLERTLTPAQVDRLYGPRAVALLAEAGPSGTPPITLRHDALRGDVYHVDAHAARAAAVMAHAPGAILARGQGPTPVRVVCRALGLERLIDADRQPVVLWPERVFTLEGQRVRVLGRAQDGVLACEPALEDVQTHKIRQVFVSEHSDISLMSDHVFAAEGIGIYRARLNIRELIIGYRTWSGRDLLRQSLYGADDRVEARYAAESVAIFLPGLDDEMAHLLAHLVRRHLRIMVGDTDDVVDVAHGCFQNFSKGVSANVYRNIVVIDNVPGGCGVCDLVTPEFLRKVAAHTVKMHEGGARWYDLHDCHYALMHVFDEVQPDAVAERPMSTAERLVDYCRHVVLAEDEDQDSAHLDYRCNLWVPDEAPDDVAVAHAAAATAATPGPVAEDLKNYADLLGLVHAEANRIGRLPMASGQGDETTCPS